ncbi:MAG: serine/threonine protein kinase [Verrucomicrobiae bacterium]|nr:serine/threonine protein kinase [Verrucomicrobiae bacterium]
MNDSSQTGETPRPRSALDGLDPRRLMAEGLGFAPEEAGTEAPVIPGYEVLRLLGSGGMGEVWLARQISLDRLVAVKVLAVRGEAATQWLDRLEREARAMARLSHPHIVAVYDFVRLEEGGAAIVMEWVGSGNLRDLLPGPGRPVRDLRSVLSTIRQIASALVAAHAAGIVHRDLKPENILIAADGSVKVTDFGLALPLGSESQRLTLTGTSMGTLGYMAPEQAEGREVDGRADLYSLGVILYELLTGVRPQGHFDPPGKTRRDLPNGLERLVLDSLRTRPQKRISSAADFLARLDRCGRTRIPLVITLALAVLVLSGVGWMMSGRLMRIQGNQSTSIGSQAVPVAEVPTPVGTAPLPEGLVVPAGWESRVAVSPLRGKWEIGKEGFRSDTDIAILRLLSSLPPEGARIRILFTRDEGPHSIALFFRTPRGTGAAELSSWETNLAGFQCLDGQDLRSLPDPPVLVIENGRRHEMVVEIRPDRFALFVDGRLVQEVAATNRELSVAYPWEWETLDTTSAWLSIASYQSPTHFHLVEVTAF